MNRKLAMGIAFLLILGLTFLLSSFFIGKKTLPPQRPIPEVKNYVKVKQVIYEDIPVNLESFGRVGSSQLLNLTAEVGGRLLSAGFNFKEGESFKEGQLLLRIQDAEQKLTIQSRKSNFLNLFATIMPDLRIDFPDSYPKWLSYYNAIDLNKELPDMPASLTVKEKAFLATANILSEYYSIKSLEENHRKYKIFAPYTGSIQAINIEVGSVVNPGATIATIIRTDKLELKVPIELKDLNYIKIGSKVSILQDGKNPKIWSGKIARKADFVDPNTQSVNIYITIDSPVGEVFDGQYLKAVINGPKIPKSMLIDRSVLRNRDEIFIVQENRLVTKKVNVLQVLQNEVIINGIDEGERIVVDAPSNASNNMKVVISD